MNVFDENDFWIWLKDQPHYNVFFLQGPMGIGKTFFAQTFVRQHLGLEEHVSSPTYSLCHVYKGLEGMIHHLDVYRLDDPNSLDLLMETYQKPPLYYLIEWSQKFSLTIWKSFFHKNEFSDPKPLRVTLRCFDEGDRRTYQVEDLRQSFSTC
jgi:tRNA threonylcarbamoyladenosine biosynthesis protein TsaE